jgi:drug/metabolite transporter (DMT)-like permease
MENSWFVYGLLAALSFACMTLTFKYILKQNVQPLILLLFVFIFISIGYIVWVYLGNISFENLNFNVFLLIILAACFAIAGNYFDVMAVKLAPNPGYAGALKASQIIIISILSVFLFSAKLTFVNLTGILFVLLGVILISL